MTIVYQERLPLHNTTPGATDYAVPTRDIGSNATAYSHVNQATYSVVGLAYAAYATPTDMITLSGSASKIIRVTNFTLGVRSTAGALQAALYWIKRSTANTGGTATQPTAVPSDSAFGAATAVVNVYSAAPTLGAAIGNWRIVYVTSTTLTQVPGVALPMVAGGFFQASAITLPAPLTLRGTAESICLNNNGAALTSGAEYTFWLEWTEE